MAKKGSGCRDCRMCTESSAKKFGKFVGHVATLGVSAVVINASESVRRRCPICGHPLSEHKQVDGRFQD